MGQGDVLAPCRQMETLRTPLIRSLVWLILFVLPSLWAGESVSKEDDNDAVDEDQWLSYGGGFSIEGHRRNPGGEGGANLDASIWLEADLGVIGADHCYAYVQPSLVWGEEEDWHWRASIYQWWLAWNGNDAIEIMGGMVDSGWHFHGLPSAGPFLRLPWRERGAFSPGAFGLPDIYPLSPPSVRVAWTPDSHIRIQAMVSALDRDHEVDGVAVREDHGLAWLAEVSWSNADEEDVVLARTFAAGCWAMPTGAYGVYFLADAGIWKPVATGDAVVSVFSSVAASREAGEENWSAGVLAGLVCSGIVPGRDEDQFAIAWSRDDRVERIKHAADILYRAELGAGWWMQAEFQWIRQPTDETVLGLRLGYDW